MRAEPASPAGQPVTLDGSVIPVGPATGLAASGNPNSGAADANAKPDPSPTGSEIPFRFTFRPGTSELSVGDVGWDTWEEIDRIPSPTAPTFKFGWPCYEGNGVQAASRPQISTSARTSTRRGPRSPVLHVLARQRRRVRRRLPTANGSSVTGAAFYAGGTYPAD